MNFTLRPQRVSEAIEALLRNRIHPVFSGYLCLKREAVHQNRNTGLIPNFREFHDLFLSVSGGPPGRPYCRPFWDETGATRERVWYQANVAGTYAPSSAQRIPAFMAVINITGKRYSLRDRHWELARQHLLFGNQVPVLPLITYLYRDFTLNLPLPARLSAYP